MTLLRLFLLFPDPYFRGETWLWLPYSMAGMGMDPSMFGGKGETLVLNANNNLVKYVLDNPDGENTPTICCQLYDLAVLANRPLSADAMTKFVARSNEILSILAK